MKKLLILGAGIYQVPLIKQAKSMGIYTIVVSIKGNYPGFNFADKVYYIDTTDYESVLKVARDEKIDGIVTTGTDVAIITVGKVCDELGLCGLSEYAANVATNKMLMKTEFENHGVRTAKFRRVHFDSKEISDATKELNYPLIFKAVDTSGSRGIIRVNKGESLTEAAKLVKNATKLDYFIIEEFITGKEFGAQAFVLNGRILFTIPHGDYVFNGNTGVPVGHFAPYALPDETVKDTEKQLNAAVKAMQLDNCAINADFILSDGKVYVLEIGGRCGATCLAELVSIYYDFNYYEKIILASLGENPSFTSTKCIPNASHLIMSEKTGRILKQTYDNIDNNNIVDVHFDYNTGDYVRKFNVGPDRIGHVITKGDSVEKAQKLLKKVFDNIHIEVNEE